LKKTSERLMSNWMPFFLALKAEALYLADRAPEAIEAIAEAEAYLLNVIAHGTWNDQRLVEIATSN
jgi:hypothetical protein